MAKSPQDEDEPTPPFVYPTLKAETLRRCPAGDDAHGCTVPAHSYRGGS